MVNKSELLTLVEPFKEELEKFSKSTSVTYTWAVRKYIESGGTFETANIKDYLNQIDNISSYNLHYSAIKWFTRINEEYFDKKGKKIYWGSILYKKGKSKFQPLVVPKEEVYEIIANAPSLMKFTALKTSYELCLRVGELCNLKEDDYNPEKPSMYVEALKKGISREMPVPDELNKDLQNYLEYKHSEFGESEKLFLTEFGNEIWPQNFSHKIFTTLVTRLYRKNIISVLPRLHDFSRHSRITHWLQEGLNFFQVNTLARHRHFDTTLNYIHLAPQEVVDSLPEDIKKKFGIYI